MHTLYDRSKYIVANILLSNQTEQITTNQNLLRYKIINRQTQRIPRSKLKVKSNSHSSTNPKTIIIKKIK
jgi:hypothetical protein